MCSIIGLNRADIKSLILGDDFQVEITNQNSAFAFVISGVHSDILNLQQAATAEGALHTHLLNVSLPYHSAFLKDSKNEFSEFIETIRFEKPRTKIISLVDQQILEEQGAIKDEVIKNLFTPLNWYQTQIEMLRSGVNLLVECGPGKNLVKNAKFIEGEYQFLTITGFLKTI
jgi:[acyl-carrier-protein] S-malonyltransferase